MNPLPTRLPSRPVPFGYWAGLVALLWCGNCPAHAQVPGRARLVIPAPRAHYGPGYYYPPGPAGPPAGPGVPPVLLPTPPLPPAPTSRDGARSRGFFRRRG
ncbi:MAG: hypothetical protein NVS3B25_24560 [Hymenobacter sp.]